MAIQAIVTGGAIRVGKAISLALAEVGYDIILIFNDSFNEAVETSNEIKAKGKNCYLHRCDISKKENIDTLFNDISRKYDDIRLLINNASVFEKHSFMETTEQVYDHHMNANFKAPFFLTQNFVQYVYKRAYIQGANVVNILDARIHEIHTGHFVYHLTKKALNEFTKMAAKDLAPKIRVNSVSLGKVLPNKELSKSLELSKYPRLKEINDAVIKLDSEDITGENIFIENDPQLI